MRLALAGVLTVALVIALGVWVFNGPGTPGEAGARPLTPAQSAAARAKASAKAKHAAASRSAAAVASSRQTAVVALPGRLDGILGGGGDTWSVSTLNLDTHQAMTLGADSGMYTGSTIKVLILETLLRTQGGAANLTADEQQEATQMITVSDNDAAVDLWQAAGGDTALQQTVTMLGLRDTTIATDGYFGVSTTSAADQITVLQQLVAPTFLTTADGQYALGLMSQVSTDQRWGAPTMADAGTLTENKNGWLDNDADDELWMINSLAVVIIGGHRYLVAVFSQHQPDFASGVQRLDAACAAIAAVLR